MKKIFLTAAVLISTIICSAQNIPLNDTIKSILYKFETNKNQYVGQPLEKVINDFGIKIELTSPGYDYNGSKIDIPKNIKKIWIDYIDNLEQDIYKEQKKSYATVLIYFKTPYTIEKKTFFRETRGKGAHYEALYLKDLIVDSVSILKYNFGESKAAKRVATPEPPKKYDKNGNEYMEFRFKYD